MIGGGPYRPGTHTLAITKICYFLVDEDAFHGVRASPTYYFRKVAKVFI